MTYSELIESKKLRPRNNGIAVSMDDIHPRLYPFQNAITRWALRIGHAAVFADCGLGKTIIQCEWARLLSAHTGKPSLIVTPLAVGSQTIEEAGLIGAEASRVVEHKPDYLVITNYHRLHRHKASDYGAIVLDESSILKNQTGATRNAIIEFSNEVPYRLACTATPSPNDVTELLNHAEYLGVMSVKQAQAVFFVNDQKDHTSHWRLKKHAQGDFWKWVSTWAVALRNPCDIGFKSMAGFDLEPYQTIIHSVRTPEPEPENGELFFTGRGLRFHRKIQQLTIEDRARAVADVVNSDDEPWVVWCHLNKESETLKKLIPDAVQVAGADSIDSKEDKLNDFSRGKARVMVTKPSIAGHGLNWQHCRKVAFVGLSYSYEQYYQAVRRVWRYGQTRPVEVHIFGTPHDHETLKAIQRKESEVNQMYEFVKPESLESEITETSTAVERKAIKTESGHKWTLHNGDCIEGMADLEESSVGLSVFSPPFPGMYVYTDDPRDMGNVVTIKEMIEQFRFCAEQIKRVLMPGRSVLIHITQCVAQKQRDGFIGMMDFRGELIRCMVDLGMIHYGEIIIDKNPQVKAIRTKDRGLMFVSLRKDSAVMHVAMPDMLLHFTKPGDNPTPIKCDVTNEEWIKWARPVWASSDTDSDGIRETHVLNTTEAKGNDDERHICPLQLDLIERVVRLWSNPDDLVLSPFAGIGSEGIVSIKHGRRFVGYELKGEYFNAATRTLKAHESQEWLF